MSRRAILALSAALTAFVLILAGATASYGLRASPAQAVTAPDAIPGDVVRAREAEYRRLIDEANARLRAAQPAAVATPAADPAPMAATRSFEHDDDEEEHEDDDG